MLDANVVNYACRPDAGHATGPADELIKVLMAGSVTIYLDSGGHIEHEWQACVDRDWFENWFMALVQFADVRYVEPRDCRALLRKLRNDMGFPKGDCAIIAAAIGAAAEAGSAALITEDCDFFDPRAKKRPNERAALLRGQRSGNVAAHLWKVEKVRVWSIGMALTALRS